MTTTIKMIIITLNFGHHFHKLCHLWWWSWWWCKTKVKRTN